tara:strand:- start:548 stop:697 length:150 start_codon:yes stop_codon:yes gene_type:complete
MVFPYDFNLFFDIKNLIELRKFYAGIMADKKLIEELAKKHNICLTVDEK